MFSSRRDRNVVEWLAREKPRCGHPGGIPAGKSVDG